MCHFVTTTLPSYSPSANVLRIVEAHDMRYAPIENLSIRDQIGSAGYFQATGGMCDCGTALGSGSKAPADGGLERELAKLRKKGWGEAKIVRWLDERGRQSKKIERRRAHEVSSPDLDSWIEFLKALVAEPEAEPAGLLLHWYSGGLENERIELSRSESILIDDLTLEFLLDIEEDVLYSFRSSAA